MSEKKESSPTPTVAPIDLSVAESQSYGKAKTWLNKISSWGIELRGVTPVPLEERKDTRFINVFFVWFTLSTTLLP
jgi:hypothetical protein